MPAATAEEMSHGLPRYAYCIASDAYRDCPGTLPGSVVSSYPPNSRQSEWPNPALARPPAQHRARRR
eukprot:scaffold236539_cov33-Tisochrysis_lutea.AAC.3